MQVKWLRHALQNLDDEAAYIAQDNPQATNALIAQVLKSVNLLGRFPNSGRAGRVFGTRELVITEFPYIIPYRVKSDTVEILRVFHTSRKWPRSL
jgi:addiction module RelE/StbE family toxin